MLSIFRVSELEVENEKIRHDYELLRSSIKSGAEVQELYGKYYELKNTLKMDKMSFIFQKKKE